MSDAPIQRFLFAPDGTIITSILVHSIRGCPCSINEQGHPEQDSMNDFPEFEDYGQDQVVLDDDGSEWLTRHCRMLTADADYDRYGEEPKLDAWDDEIVKLCCRVAKLVEAKWMFGRAQNALPHGFSDAIVGTVLEKVVLGRIETELADLEPQIAAYRASRVEIESVDELPCATCAASTEQRVMPCDECGALDESMIEESEDV